jgi:hypothetical protein
MRQLIRTFAALPPALVLVLLVGCAGEASMGTVSGEVTYDGQPLKQGLIRFVPADGQSPTADTTITDGKFTATVPAGEKKVEITAPKVVRRLQMYPGAPEVEEVVESLPPRYNVNTELRMTVQKGAQEQRFELKQ